jgi:UDP-3-O-[3-hydroxymyristoyl] glucosamine N-acyltransferase
MQRSLKEVAEFVGGSVVGDPATLLNGVASLESARVGDLVFVEEESNLERALGSKASAVLVGDFAGKQGRSKPLLVTDNPRLGFARAATLLRAKPNRSAGVHPSAVVLASATLGTGVSVEAHAAIAGNAVIGEGTWIGFGTVIGEGVHIGKWCEIFPNVTIYSGTILGDRVTIHAGAVLGSDGFGYVCDPRTGRYEKFPQIGSLQIEDDVEIGANTTIDRGALDATVVRRGTKLDNLIHVGHNVEIGQDVVIAAQTGISGSSVVEDGVVMGGQVGIGDHARIESGVILGGQCGVLPKKVVRGKGMLFWGTPVRPIREYLKQLAALARLAKKG